LIESREVGLAAVREQSPLRGLGLQPGGLCVFSPVLSARGGQGFSEQLPLVLARYQGRKGAVNQPEIGSRPRGLWSALSNGGGRRRGEGEDFRSSCGECLHAAKSGRAFVSQSVIGGRPRGLWSALSNGGGSGARGR